MRLREGRVGLFLFPCWLLLGLSLRLSRSTLLCQSATEFGRGEEMWSLKLGRPSFKSLLHRFSHGTTSKLLKFLIEVCFLAAIRVKSKKGLKASDSSGAAQLSYPCPLCTPPPASEHCLHLISPSSFPLISGPVSS